MILIVLVFISIPALSLLFLQNRQIQTLISRFAADKLSEELGTRITLSSVNYSFFNRISVRDLYVEDQRGDTLLYSEVTRFRLKTIKPGKSDIEIRKILLDNAKLYLLSDSSGHLNLEFITDRIKDMGSKGEGGGSFMIREIEASNSAFRLRFDIRKPTPYGIDFTDLEVRPFNLTIKDLYTHNDTVRMNIDQFSGIEKSGFRLMEFSTGLLLTSDMMEFSDSRLRAPESDLHLPLIAFDFNNWQNFQNVYDSVNIHFIAAYSSLTLGDLAYVVPFFEGFDQTVSVEGEITGMLSDLRSRDLKINFNHHTQVDLSMIMIGLPDVRNTLMHLNFRQLSTNLDDFNQVFRSAGLRPVAFPETIDPFGNITYKGRFTGYTDDFVAFGQLSTELGDMALDLSLKPDTGNSLRYHGRLETRGLKLGTLLDREDIVGEIAMNVLVDGNIADGSPSAEMDGQINSLLFYNYPYQNIQIKGALSDRRFDGFFTIRDPNIQMDFTGKMDFSTSIPVFDFTADVARARPYYLHLSEKDPDFFASFLLKTNFSGKEIDQINGDIHLINSFFGRSDKQLQMYNLTLEAVNTTENSSFSLRSDLLDADMKGNYRLSTLPVSLKGLVNHYISLFPHNKEVKDTATWFDFNISLKNVTPLFDFFLPEYQISNNAKISGHYDLEKDQLLSQVDIPYFEIGKNRFTNMQMETESDSVSFHANTRLSSVKLASGMVFAKPEANLYARDGSTWFDMNWDNRDSIRNAGEIRAGGRPVPSMYGKRQAFAIDIYPSRLYFEDSLWNLSRATVLIDSSSFSVDSLILEGNKQYMLANGTLSDRDNSKFNLAFRQIDLGQISTFVKNLSFALDGVINGQVEFRNEKGKPLIITDLTVADFELNNTLIGTTDLKAHWIEEQNKLSLSILARKDDRPALEIAGDYYPGSDRLDFDLDLENLDIGVLTPYFSAFAEDLKGIANGTASLDGTLHEPEINGTVKFNACSLRVPYLQTVYSFSDKLRIYKNNLFFDNFLIRDVNNNTAHLDGNITNNLLQDIRLNLNFQAENFNFMNTTSLDNDLFYGTVFGSGNIKFSGPVEKIRIDINATSEKNTYFYLPLYTASEVQQNDFITFIRNDDDSLSSPSEEGEEASGLTMNIELNVTPDASVQLIFDPKVGDIIEASGAGKLLMTYDEKGDFKMYGEVVVDRGNYLFTLQNVINKRFEVKPGGSISWNGPPENANINLQAVYNLRVAPYNLSPDPDNEKESLKKRIPVQCIITLMGDLMKPTITPAIDMPTADPETKDLLSNSTGSEEELMKQFISLMVINNFYSVNGLGTDFTSPVISTNAGFVTASEMFSNQLSNWLSQISNDFDIGFKLRPGDEVTPSEVEVALTYQLLNDRVILSGDVDFAGPDQQTPNASNIVGNVNVEVKLTNNISFKAFNRANDDIILQTAPYTQGIGVFYREEFDNVDDLKEKYRAILNRDDKKRRKKESPPSVKPASE